MKLNGDGEIVPERLVPIHEGRCDAADRPAGNNELAIEVLVAAPDHVASTGGDDPRIDAVHQHRLVLRVLRERRECGRHRTGEAEAEHPAPRKRRQASTPGVMNMLFHLERYLPLAPNPEKIGDVALDPKVAGLVVEYDRREFHRRPF